MGHHAGSIEVGSLRHMLKTNTKEIHDVADNAMRSFLFEDEDCTSLPAYRHFLLQLHLLYEAMESELSKNSENAIVGPIHFPDELNRLGLLERDLDFYYKGKWREIYEQNITPGMQRYVDRIREIGKSQPELLVAHSYTRYLGDMSGGQILKKMIKKRYDLKGDDGVQFYAFDHVESIGKFKELYTARMNSLNLTANQKEDMVEEAKRIFQFNIDVFNEVGSRFKPNSNFDEGYSNESSCSQNGNQLNGSSSLWGSTSVLKISLAVGASALIFALSPWMKGALMRN